MNPDELRGQYTCEYVQDPVVKEIVSFLLYASESEIMDYKKNGLLPNPEYHRAKRILEQEKEQD